MQVVPFTNVVIAYKLVVHRPTDCLRTILCKNTVCLTTWSCIGLSVVYWNHRRQLNLPTVGRPIKWRHGWFLTGLAHTLRKASYFVLWCRLSKRKRRLVTKQKILISCLVWDRQFTGWPNSAPAGRLTRWFKMRHATTAGTVHYHKRIYLRLPLAPLGHASFQPYFHYEFITVCLVDFVFGIAPDLFDCIFKTQIPLCIT